MAKIPALQKLTHMWAHCGHWYLHDWIKLHKNALTGVHETGYEWQLIGVVNTWLFQTG